MINVLYSFERGSELGYKNSARTARTNNNLNSHMAPSRDRGLRSRTSCSPVHSSYILEKCFVHSEYLVKNFLQSCIIFITSSNQRLWECVRCRINVYPDILNDFPSWLSTSKNQPCFINNRGFTERYFSNKVHASLINWWLRCVTAPVSVESHV